jgi:uncharacterized damage-inducible protein DinB
MTVDELRTLFDYDRWANRRLWEAVAGLPPEATDREIGSQFSFPTLKGMLAHILGAHIVWLNRWQGESPASVPSGKDFPDLSALRARWDQAEGNVADFTARLSESYLGKNIQYRNIQGQAFALPLGPLMQHLTNHGTHHRSEVATMLTMLGVSPPPTDLVVYHLVRTAQMA